MMKFGLTAISLATAVILALPSSAVAGTLIHPDPAGDVIFTDMLGSGDTSSPAPARANGDIVATRLAFSAEGVRVKVRFRDLARTGSLVTVTAIRSNSGYRSLTLIAKAGHYAGRTHLTNYSGKAVRCAGLAHAIDYRLNTVLLTVPRTCLGKSARWVRIGVGEVTFGANLASAYVDDARTNGTAGGQDPTLSPRIYR